MGVIYKQISRHDAIQDLAVAQLSIHQDMRGGFGETWQYDGIADILPKDATFLPARELFSYTYPGGIRGYHAETACDKLAVVVHGEGWAHFLELRDNDNFGRIVTFPLNRGTNLFIPSGVGNSFESSDLSDEIVYVYLVNQKYRVGVTEPAIHPFDPAFEHEWVISRERAILGERDKATPFVSDERNAFHERAKKYGLI